MLFLIVSSTQAEELNTLFLQGVSEVPSVLKKILFIHPGIIMLMCHSTKKKPQAVFL